MESIWNNAALLEDISKGYVFKVLSFGERDEWGMYVETITYGIVTRYYVQNPYGMVTRQIEHYKHPS